MLQTQFKLQQEHKNKVWHPQKDLDDSRRDRDRKTKLADKIAPWTDKDQPASYLRKFEDMLYTAGISKEEWASPPGTSTDRNYIYSLHDVCLRGGQGRLQFTENGLAEGARTFERSLRARVLVLPKERCLRYYLPSKRITKCGRDIHGKLQYDKRGSPECSNRKNFPHSTHWKTRTIPEQGSPRHF